jgi:cyanophycinase
MMRPRRVFAFAVLLSAAVGVWAQEVGPAKGMLIAAGGGNHIQPILKRFIELAGGAGAPIVLIPTASGLPEYGPWWFDLKDLREAGAKNVTLLHTSDPKVADTDEFVEPIRQAKGVWFGGGRQWRLADSYLGTRTQRELEALLARGGIIGGTSAGATIQGSYLVRGDTKSNTIMMGDHEVGFGFLKNVTIDQHVLKRNRHFDMLEVIEEHPELLGIGIDEDTAIAVVGDMFQVIGESYVLIYDNQRTLDSGGRFYFLAPGDRYNLKTREAVRAVTEEKPIERVEKQPWGAN